MHICRSLSPGTSSLVWRLNASLAHPYFSAATLVDSRLKHTVLWYLSNFFNDSHLIRLFGLYSSHTSLSLIFIKMEAKGKYKYLAHEIRASFRHSAAKALHTIERNETEQHEESAAEGHVENHVDPSPHNTPPPAVPFRLENLPNWAPMCSRRSHSLTISRLLCTRRLCSTNSIA